MPPALAGPDSGPFKGMQPNPAIAEFLVGFLPDASPAAVHSVMAKTNESHSPNVIH